MYPESDRADLYQTKLSSLFSKSREEFIRDFRKLDEENAKIIYLQVLTEIKNAVVVDNVKSLTKLNNLIEYISQIKDDQILESYFNNADNPIINTNLVILACKHNSIQIQEYLFSSQSNILVNLSLKVARNSILPTEFDEESHNAFYYAIRSCNIKLLETVINKWPGEYFTNHPDELEELLSKAYEELKCKNVALSKEVELFIENKLINLRFFSNDSEDRENIKTSLNSIIERIDLVLENINLLKLEDSDVEEVDAKFLLRAKFIALNIHILKRQLRSTYKVIPWEEMEFCLISFIRSKQEHQEINLIYNSVLTKEKVLKHLENFANQLNNEKSNIKYMNLRGLSELPKIHRERVVADIISKYPHFEEMYNDYKKIRDIYSLETISSYIELALSADTKDKEGQLIITRTLQVIGEYLKNTLESPKLSKTTCELLLFSLPRNTREIATDLRNSLSHVNSLSQRTEMEENADITFFNNVQNDVKKIRVIIIDFLFKTKIQEIKKLLKRLIDNESVDEIRKIAEIFKDVKVEKIVLEDSIVGEHGKIGRVIQELSQLIVEKTTYQQNLFEKIFKIINSEKTKLGKVQQDYHSGLSLLKKIHESINNNYIDHNSARAIKFIAKRALDNITTNMDKECFKEIASLAKMIANNALPRLPNDAQYQITLIILKILYIAEFEIDNVKWIQELRDNLNKKSEPMSSDYEHKWEKTSIPENKLLEQKLSTLKGILKNRALNHKLEEKLSSYKNNKKLQAVIEMLVLDIMSILGNSKNYLTDNLLFLDNNSPLLIGKSLRNHLAHGNALLDILLFDPSIAVILNARKIISENITLEGERKLGKLIRDNPIKLKCKYEEDLKTIANQKKMFVALTEGNLEDLITCISKGADLNARSINLWTALHFAAKGPNVLIVKYVLNKNISFDVRDPIGQTPLHIAAAYGRKSTVEFFLEELEVNIDDTNKSGKTPLHIAAQFGHKNVVKVLLKNKANTSVKCKSGFAPLHYALQNNHMEAAKLLFEKEANFDANESLGGYTPLHVAVDAGHLELVNFLIENKANVNAKNDRGIIPLHIASLNGFLDIIKVLIKKGSNVNAKVLDGCTPLHYAAENSHEEVVKILLENGAKANVVENVYKFAPINYGAMFGKRKIIEAFLKHKANVNVANVYGFTPLHFAAQAGHHDIVDILMENKAAIEAKTDDGYTPLLLAALNGHASAVQALIKHKAKVNTRDKNNSSPLHAAASAGMNDVIEALIKGGADVNSVDKNGHTALHLSSATAHKDFVKALIDKGADINARDNKKMTPIHAATSKDQLEIIKILKDAGADIKSKDISGTTVLHLAALNGNKEIANYLIEQNINVNIKNTLRQTPLNFAVEGNHVEVTKTLIRKGCQLNPKDHEGKIPLLCAVINNYVEIVNVLLANGAGDVEIIDVCLELAVLAGFTEIVDSLLEKSNDINPRFLHTAASNGHAALVRLLLAKGLKVNSRNEVGNITALYLGSSKGCKDVVEVLIANKADVNMKCDGGQTALHIASGKGHVEVVKLLLKNGANPNVKDESGRTPLVWAVIHGNVPIVKSILKYSNTDINKIRVNGLSLLHLAAQTCQVDVLIYLIDNGADIHVTESLGLKAIHIAAKEGGKSIVEYFIKNKLFNVNTKGMAGLSLLHMAVIGGQPEVIKYLLQQNVDVNVTDAVGAKPITYAVQQDNEDIVKMLINNGADCDSVNKFDTNSNVNRVLTLNEKLFDAVKCNDPTEVEICIKEGALINGKNSSNVTPLHFASWKGYGKVVDVLLRNKANPNTSGKGNCMPLHYAAKFSHLEIVKVLLANGAIYDAKADNQKTPLDFTEHKRIIDLLKLIDDSFKNVSNGNSRVLYDLKKIKDMATIKAVMNACNKDKHSLVVVATLKNFPQLDKLKEMFQDDFVTDLLMVKVLLAKESWPEALNIYRMVFEKRKQIFGPKNPATLDMQDWVAKILYKQLKYQEALEIYQEIYQKQKEVLGPNCKDTLNTRSSIALVIHRQGKDEESLKIFKEVYKKQKEILAPDDSDILSTEAHMAAALDRLGRYDEALQLNYNVLENRKKTLGPDHPVCLTIQNNIAMFLNNQGKHKEAYDMYTKVYEGRKKELGPCHSDTLRTLHNRIGILAQQQKFDEAINAYKELYEIQKSNIGVNHLDTLTTKNNMAELLLKQGKIIAAYKIYKETLEQRKAILGPNHPHIFQTKKILEAIQGTFLLQGDHGMDTLKYLETDINEAANKGDIKLVESLIENGFDIDVKDVDGRTPIHFAINGGHLDVVKCLLKHGADPTQPTKKGNTPLHTAVNKGLIDIVNTLLEHVKKLNYNSFNKFIDAKTSSGGTTALHVAAKNGFEEIVKKLLSHGAVYNRGDNSKKSPVQLSKENTITNLFRLTNEIFEDVNNGNDKVIDKLEKLKPDEFLVVTNARNNKGNTLLQVALGNKNSDIGQSVLNILQPANKE